MNLIRVAIAEDNKYALNAILAKLAPYSSSIKIEVTAQDGASLLQQLQTKPVDLILMDIEMPVMDGLECTKQVTTAYPNIKVLILTTFDDDDKIFNAILNGANGYILKEEPSIELHTAIIDTLNGGAAMSASIALKTIEHVRRLAAPVTRQRDAETDCILSKRELQILEQLKGGNGYKQIAAELFISEGTVRKHIENIYRKLQVNNKVSAINIAVSNKWL